MKNQTDDQPLVTPIGKNIVLIADEARTESKGGLAIPERARQAPPTSIVHAIGPSVRNIEVGDRVLVPSFAGVQMTFPDHDFTFAVVSSEDVLAIVHFPDRSEAAEATETLDPAELATLTGEEKSDD